MKVFGVPPPSTTDAVRGRRGRALGGGAAPVVRGEVGGGVGRGWRGGGGGPGGREGRRGPPAAGGRRARPPYRGRSSRRLRASCATRDERWRASAPETR